MKGKEKEEEEMKRIFLKKYDSAGKFPDERVKLDVYLEDSEDPPKSYVWTPQWKALRSFFLEAYRVEKLNRVKGQELEKFQQIGEKILTGKDEEEIEGYREIPFGWLEGLEAGRVLIQEKDGFLCHIPFSLDFRAKILVEAKNLYNWLRIHRGDIGKWIIVNEELFDVEWKEK